MPGGIDEDPVLLRVQIVPVDHEKIVIGYRKEQPIYESLWQIKSVSTTDINITVDAVSNSCLLILAVEPLLEEGSKDRPSLVDAASRRTSYVAC